MPHITLSEELPGLLGLFAYRPDTAQPLLQLIASLMEGPSSLSQGERELIGSLVSADNDSEFCTQAHGAFAASTIAGGAETVERAQRNPDETGLTPRVQALIDVARATSRSGHAVTDELVESARRAGASEQDVHDAVLIASTFALFTRYVDGLATQAPNDPQWYQSMAGALCEGGYAGMGAMLAGAPAREPATV